MSFNQTIDEYIENRRSEDLEIKFIKSWRVLCDGKVISQTPHRHGEDFAKRGAQTFCDNIKSAFDAKESGVEWDWVGYGGRMTASEWLLYHSQRLGMTLTSNVEVVGPGDEYPLAPKIEGIV